MSDEADKECGSNASTPVSEEIVQSVISDIHNGATTTLDINSTEFRVALIEQIKLRPEIWNPRSAGVGQQREHREAAKQAWEDVCAALNADASVAPMHTVVVDEAKRCWKQLRDSFTRCVRDEVKHGKRRRRTTWPFYSSLEFLRSVVGSAWSAANSDAPTMVNNNNDNDSTTTETSVAASNSPALPAVAASYSPDTPVAAKRPRTAEMHNAGSAAMDATTAAVNNENGLASASSSNDLSTLLALVTACQQSQQNQNHAANNINNNNNNNTNSLGLDSMLQGAILSSLAGQSGNPQQTGGGQGGDASAWLQLASMLGAVPTDAIDATQPQQQQQKLQRQQQPKQQQPRPAVSDDDVAFGRTVSGCLSRLSGTSRELAKVRINRVLTEAALSEQTQMDSSVSMLFGGDANTQQLLLAAAAAAALTGGTGAPAPAAGNVGQAVPQQQQQQHQQQTAAALQLRQLHSLAQLQQTNGKLDLSGF